MHEVKTQAQLNAALKKGETDIVLRGEGCFEIKDNTTVKAGGNATVKAWGNTTVKAWGNTTVKAWGNATVKARGNTTVEAWGNTTVEAWGNTTVKAWGNTTVKAGDNATVEAWANVFIRLFGGLKIIASASVVILIHKKPKSIKGGQQIKAIKPKTAKAWCEHYGVTAKRGIATLFKAVGDDFISSHNFAYEPGTIPKAPDWDGGKKECGGGLHFSPRPWMAKSFNPGATRFIGCPVRLKDIAVHPDGLYPEKIKAKGCAKAVFEVDIDGSPIKEDSA